MKTILKEHIKYIQVLLGDETFGDYVRISLSNPNNYYTISDFDQAKYILKAGYKNLNTGEDYLLRLFSGYTIISKIQSTLPNELEITLQNRFFSLGRLILGSTSFTGMKLSQIISFYKDTLNLNDNEILVLVPDTLLQKKIIKFKDTEISYLDALKSIAEAFNLWIYWDYYGRLIFKERSIPSSSSYTIPSEKVVYQEEIRPYRKASKIIVVGRDLYYWEQSAPTLVIGTYKKLCLDHSRRIDPYGGIRDIRYAPAGFFNLVYSISPAWANEILISPSQIQCRSQSGSLYSANFSFVSQKDCVVEVKVINKDLYECCLRSSDKTVYEQIFFDITLKGYKIKQDEKYTRVYTEYNDTAIEIKQGGKIIRRIDNYLIPDLDVATRILETEKILNELEENPISVEIPFNPLIERFDRLSVLTSSGSFDMFVNNIEHTFEPSSGKSKTILKGYKIT